MTKIHHPINKLERELAKKRKHRLSLDEKKQKELERANRVWLKLNKELLRDKETYDALRAVKEGSNLSV